MRSLILASVVALFAFPNLSSAAWTVEADFLAVQPGVVFDLRERQVGDLTTEAGAMQWQKVGGNAPLTNQFTTFCIELSQYVPNPGSGTFTVTTNLASVPTPGGGAGNGGSDDDGGMGALKARYLSNLFAQFFASIGNDQVRAAAFQLAIWEIVHDDVPRSGNGYGVGSSEGDFFVRNYTAGSVQAQAVSQANAWLQQLNANGAQMPNLVAMTSNQYQDQVTVATPAPPALFLALTGLAGLGGACWYNRSRRRGTAFEPAAAI